MARKKQQKRKSQDEHGKKGIKTSLHALGAIWGDVEGIEFGDVPDAKYQIQFAGITLNESQSSGRFQCSWDMKIVAGDHKNQHLFKHDGLDNEESLSYFKGGLARLGVECEDSKDLPGVLEELLGTFAVVTARTKRGADIQNVYFDRALDSDDVEDPGDDDVPEVAEAEGVEEDVWEVGNKCKVLIDDEEYVGEITTIDDEGTEADIQFDDGDTGTHPIDDLIEIEDEEAAADDEPEEAVDDDKLKLDFDEDSISEKQEEAINKLATKH